jgi:hypothetical protein
VRLVRPSFRPFQGLPDERQMNETSLDIAMREGQIDEVLLQVNLIADQVWFVC